MACNQCDFLKPRTGRNLPVVQGVNSYRYYNDDGKLWGFPTGEVWGQLDSRTVESMGITDVIWYADRVTFTSQTAGTMPGYIAYYTPNTNI